MIITIIVFDSSYEKGVWIDSKIEGDWTEPQAVWNLMECHDPEDEAAREAVRNQMSPEALKEADRMSRAFKGMELRARVNPRMNGPHVFFTTQPMSDEQWVEYAKDKLFNKELS